MYYMLFECIVFSCDRWPIIQLLTSTSRWLSMSVACCLLQEERQVHIPSYWPCINKHNIELASWAGHIMQFVAEIKPLYMMPTTCVACRDNKTEMVIKLRKRSTHGSTIAHLDACVAPAEKLDAQSRHGCGLDLKTKWMKPNSLKSLQTHMTCYEIWSLLIGDDLSYQ